MKKFFSILLICFSLILTIGTNIAFTDGNYNPDEITYPTFSNKLSQEKIKKDVNRIFEGYNGEIYVKRYKNFNEIKSHIIKGTGSMLYDPEVSSKFIRLFKAYRINDSTDEFEAIFIDYVDI